MFKPHIQNVTATAIIEGLAVAKYYHGEARWEVVFLRNCGHYPKLIIRKVDRRSGRVLTIIKRHEIAQDDSISITVSSPDESVPWRYQTGGTFDRNPNHDAQDLRWMLDIQKLHGREVARTGDIKTNSLFITNGCFYTSIRTGRAYRKRWIAPDGEHTPIEVIGLTGRTFGSDSKGDSVTVEVKGNGGFRETLKHENDARYEIIFDNTCVDEQQPTLGQTDFHFYYRLFDPSHGRVEIFPPVDSENVVFSGEEINTSEINGEAAGINAEDTEPEPDPIQKSPACQSITDLSE